MTVVGNYFLFLSFIEFDNEENKMKRFICYRERTGLVSSTPFARSRTILSLLSFLSFFNGKERTNIDELSSSNLIVIVCRVQRGVETKVGLT